MVIQSFDRAMEPAGFTSNRCLDAASCALVMMFSDFSSHDGLFAPGWYYIQAQVVRPECTPPSFSVPLIVWLPVDQSPTYPAPTSPPPGRPDPLITGILQQIIQGLISTIASCPTCEIYVPGWVPSGHPPEHYGFDSQGHLISVS